MRRTDDSAFDSHLGGSALRQAEQQPDMGEPGCAARGPISLAIASIATAAHR
jgi:hypothetical protein